MSEKFLCNLLLGLESRSYMTTYDSIILYINWIWNTWLWYHDTDKTKRSFDNWFEKRCNWEQFRVQTPCISPWRHYFLLFVTFALCAAERVVTWDATLTALCAAERVTTRDATAALPLKETVWLKHHVEARILTPSFTRTLFLGFPTRISDDPSSSRVRFFPIPEELPSPRDTLHSLSCRKQMSAWNQRSHMKK